MSTTYHTLLRNLLFPGLRVAGSAAALVASVSGQTVYDFGNPTAEEQHYIELINRARANPQVEGARLAATTDPDVLAAYASFGVDLAMMQSEFDLIPSLPPLAPNASLTTAARGHSKWMFDNDTQSHNQTNPSNTPHERIIAAGYSPITTGENIFAYGKNSWHGHAGFQVDWGLGGTGGMQLGRGHRMSIHSANFREIGIGIVMGNNGGVGPQVVTQNFGSPLSGANFATGVAYYDLNGNNFYDAGEGISGLSVTVQGASASCITAVGGGWAVPIPNTEATRTVTFAGLGINQSASLPIPASSNAKTDLKLVYAPPAITSSPTGLSGSPHPFTFTAVGGATAYQWKRWNLSAAPVQNCEDTNNIIASTTGTYSVVNSTIKQQGNSSFHLENSTADSQSIELDHLYFGGTLPAISFQSRIRASTTSEQFKVQIQETGTSVWHDVDVQTGGTAESAFSLRSAQIPTMAGKLFRVRFLLYFSGGSYFPHSGDDFGWFIDAITFTQTSLAANLASQLLPSTTGSFTPTPGSHLMLIAPLISGIEFPPAYQVFTTSDAPLSTNADLANLVLSAGTLTPSFAATTTSYSANVSNPVSSLTVTPTAAHPAASITVNGTTVASGAASPHLPLAIGANTLTIVVTAESGNTRTYSLTITRAPPPLSANADLASLVPSKGSLNPAFSAATSSYNMRVKNTVSSLSITPTAAHEAASIQVDGTLLASGTSSGILPLSIGENHFTIIVTAQNGTARTYSLTVTRPPSSNARLAALQIKGVSLKPRFKPGRTLYRTTVRNSITSVRVLAKTSSREARMKINGRKALSGKFTKPVRIRTKTNTVVKIVVRAGNGSQKIYRIVLERKSAATTPD